MFVKNYQHNPINGNRRCNKFFNRGEMRRVIFTRVFMEKNQHDSRLSLSAATNFQISISSAAMNLKRRFIGSTFDFFSVSRAIGRILQDRDRLLQALIDHSTIIARRTMATNGEKNGVPPIKIPEISTSASTVEKSPAPIDAGSSLRKPLSLWPGVYHSPVTQALWEARSSIFESPGDPSSDAIPSSDLLTKSPSQSRISIVYNFSADFVLREQYRDPWNEVRIGKLLEDLDALAGTIAFKHCCNNESTTRPLLLVTASVDKMMLKKPIRVDSDLKMAGAVTWVGRSSIELRMEVTQASDPGPDADRTALTAYFTFVARDSKTGKSTPVNRLAPQTEPEKKLQQEGEARDRLRKKTRELEREGHSFHGELARLKTLLAEGRVFCDLPALADRDSILIRDTALENSLICQPQQRNIHGRIFGGFLMNRAFELAFSTAYAFAGQMPSFLEVDHVDFLRPVDVGDFLRFKSCVLYTQLENPSQPLINIEVVAHVTKPELRRSEVSNTFYFTFTVRPESLRDGLRIRTVVPATEEEARRVIERVDAEDSYFSSA
ncbi:thioesterase/thiol ester dehydrase-isomerase superfamily protein [Wolffia australiana]